MSLLKIEETFKKERAVTLNKIKTKNQSKEKTTQESHWLLKNFFKQQMNNIREVKTPIPFSGKKESWWIWKFRFMNWGKRYTF